MIKQSNLSILQNLNESILSHQKDLLRFQESLTSKISNMKNIQLDHKNNLKNYLDQLKDIFKCLEEELIGDLPLVFAQFLQIMSKITEAYQQKIQKLTEQKEKWEENYQSLFFITQNNSINIEDTSDHILIQPESKELFDGISSKLQISRESQSINEFRLKSDDSLQIKDLTTQQNSVMLKRKEKSKRSFEFWNQLRDQIWSYESLSKEKENKKRKKSCDVNLYNKKNQRIFKRLSNYRKNGDTKRISLHEKM